MWYNLLVGFIVGLCFALMIWTVVNVAEWLLTKKDKAKDHEAFLRITTQGDPYGHDRDVQKHWR